MNTDIEFEKLEQVDANGQFTHRGIVYALDVEATEQLKVNENLGGKPLKKLIGTSEAGITITAWSHDCESVEGRGKPTMDWTKKEICEYLDEEQGIEVDKKLKKEDLLSLIL